MFTLDTGRHFPETLETLEASENRYGLNIRVMFPDAREVEELVARDGIFGFRLAVENRKACCDVRKVRPLNRALEGAKGWVTGLRREQSAGRAHVPFAAWDAENALVKIEPDRRLEPRASSKPTSPSTTSPSIRCTRAASRPSAASRARAPSSRGEDIRAGRWWWENEDGKECGLHNRPRQKEASCMTAPFSHLDMLEAETIHIFREAAAQFRKPVLMYSIGKDSTVLLHLARKAFWPQKPPFPLLHIDTTWKFKDMIAFRDKTVRDFGLDLIVHTNEEGLKQAASIPTTTRPPSTPT